MRSRMEGWCLYQSVACAPFSPTTLTQLKRNGQSRRLVEVSAKPSSLFNNGLLNNDRVALK